MYSSGTDARRFHVLVIDDSADTAESFAELLGFHGYDARAVGSAAAALDAAAAWPVDVVLLDLVMPGVSGYELARRLRSHGAACPVLVAVTGLSATGPGSWPRNVCSISS